MKPIIFSTGMVQAILSGKKTQTRMTIKPQPTEKVCFGICTDSFSKKDVGKFGFGEIEPSCEVDYVKRFIKPKCQVDDIVYVRETWCKLYNLDSNENIIESTGKYYYAADNPKFPYTHFLRDNGTYKDYPAWKPSIHMPREAARIFLKITNVRAERLQDITPEDCHDEGIKFRPFTDSYPNFKEWLIKDYSELWDSLHKKDGYTWASNPFVWVYSFERVEETKGGVCE